MSDIFRIAIDGPAGAGKTTVAKMLSDSLGIDRIDTGAMYRAVALKLLRTGTDHSDAAALDELLKKTSIDFSGSHVQLDGEDVEALIRTPEISELASASSANPAIRKKLVALQKELGRKKSVVMDGRDITTNVLKDAEYKFFLTASVHERAQRRFLELSAKGQDVTLEEVENDMQQRDYRDSHREHNPLICADDAVMIDSTDMTADEVVDKMLQIINEGNKNA